MQVGATFENIALTRRRIAVVAFMILQLLEDPNDRVMRGKTREWLKELAEKGMFQTIIQLHRIRLQLRRWFNFSNKNYWTNIIQHGRPNDQTMLDRANLER